MVYIPAAQRRAGGKAGATRIDHNTNQQLQQQQRRPTSTSRTRVSTSRANSESGGGASAQQLQLQQQQRLPLSSSRAQSNSRSRVSVTRQQHLMSDDGFAAPEGVPNSMLSGGALAAGGGAQSRATAAGVVGGGGGGKKRAGGVATKVTKGAQQQPSAAGSVTARLPLRSYLHRWLTDATPLLESWIALGLKVPSDCRNINCAAIGKDPHDHASSGGAGGGDYFYYYYLNASCQQQQQQQHNAPSSSSSSATADGAVRCVQPPTPWMGGGGGGHHDPHQSMHSSTSASSSTTAPAAAAGVSSSSLASIDSVKFLHFVVNINPGSIQVAKSCVNDAIAVWNEARNRVWGVSENTSTTTNKQNSKTGAARAAATTTQSLRLTRYELALRACSSDFLTSEERQLLDKCGQLFDLSVPVSFPSDFQSVTGVERALRIAAVLERIIEASRVVLKANGKLQQNILSVVAQGGATSLLQHQSAKSATTKKSTANHHGSRVGGKAKGRLNRISSSDVKNSSAAAATSAIINRNSHHHQQQLNIGTHNKLTSSLFPLVMANEVHSLRPDSHTQQHAHYHFKAGGAPPGSTTSSSTTTTTTTTASLHKQQQQQQQQRYLDSLQMHPQSFRLLKISVEESGTRFVGGAALHRANGERSDALRSIIAHVVEEEGLPLYMRAAAATASGGAGGIGARPYYYHQQQQQQLLKSASAAGGDVGSAAGSSLLVLDDDKAPPQQQQQQQQQQGSNKKSEKGIDTAAAAAVDGDEAAAHHDPKSTKRRSTSPAAQNPSTSFSGDGDKVHDDEDDDVIVGGDGGGDDSNNDNNRRKSPVTTMPAMQQQSLKASVIHHQYRARIPHKMGSLGFLPDLCDLPSTDFLVQQQCIDQLAKEVATMSRDHVKFFLYVGEPHDVIRAVTVSSSSSSLLSSLSSCVLGADDNDEVHDASVNFDQQFSCCIPLSETDAFYSAKIDETASDTKHKGTTFPFSSDKSKEDEKSNTDREEDVPPETAKNAGSDGLPVKEDAGATKAEGQSDSNRELQQEKQQQDDEDSTTPSRGSTGMFKFKFNKNKKDQEQSKQQLVGKEAGEGGQPLQADGSSSSFSIDRVRGSDTSKQALDSTGLASSRGDGVGVTSKKKRTRAEIFIHQMYLASRAVEHRNRCWGVVVGKVMRGNSDGDGDDHHDHDDTRDGVATRYVAGVVELVLSLPNS